MEEQSILRGVATINFWADDVEAAKAWYTEFLGVEAYFERQGINDKLAYVEFRIGDYHQELGIIDRAYCQHENKAQSGGIVVYWSVSDLTKTLDKLTNMNATLIEKPTKRGSGFITAGVLDPFGNILGVMQNPHYLEILEKIVSSK